MKFSTLRTDPNREQEGVWVSYEGDVKLKVCRLSNPRARQYAEDLRRPHARELKRVNDVKHPLLRSLMQKVVARYVLVGWQNILDDDDKPVPYSEQQALKFFEMSDDFFDDVVEFASDRELFRTEAIEDDAGN